MALKEKLQGNQSKAAESWSQISPSSASVSTNPNSVALHGTLPPLYKRVEVLDAEQHKHLGVESGGTGFAFAGTSDVLPLVLAEFNMITKEAA